MGVLSKAEVKATFGSFAYRVNADRSIFILSGWEEANITTVLIPQLVGVPTYGGTFSGRVRWHVKGVEQLQRAWEDAGKAGVLACLEFWDGSFVPRLMTGSTEISRHAWGIAFDVNARWNPYGRKAAPPNSVGSVHPLVPIFERHGLCWGGDWTKPDAMHFELNRLIDYGVSLEEGPLLVINDDATRTLACSLTDNHAMAMQGDVARVAGLPAPVNGADKVIPIAEYLRANGFRVLWHPEQGAHGKVYAYKG